MNWRARLTRLAHRRSLRIALGVLAVALLILAIAGASCFGRVVGGAERHDAWDTPPAPCKVAIAFRDNVPDDQKRVSKLYTVPFLAAAYDDARYFVADGWDSKQRDVADALERAHATGCRVDLFLLVHGGDYARWVERVRPEARPPLGLVYDTGGGDTRFASSWSALGAQAYVAHPGANIAPAFYTFFLPLWAKGASAEDARLLANAATLRVLRIAFALDLADEDDVVELWQGTEAQLTGARDFALDTPWPPPAPPAQPPFIYFQF